ncbi:MAG: Ig-like domain-containing protein [Anaerolineae bacterium]|nr:Ig-like domain-containing protein [Anaerolineae bacterium]
MKKHHLLKRVLWVVTLALIIGLPLHKPGLAQDGGEYFDATGHWVEGVFLEYFRSHGGLEIFGYPLTEAFIDQGLLVQYFQNARIEWHPTNPDPYKIQLGLLGDELNYRHPPVSEPYPKSRRKVYFPETQHTVAYAFLDYFNAHGGIDIFGYPITEMYFEEGKIVQYFQRLKMEWYPDDPSSTVRVGPLGSLYVEIHKDRMPLEALQRVPEDARAEATAPATPVITEIRAVISLRYSVMSQKRDQIVSLLVTDSNNLAVANAQVAIHFEAPTGEILPASDLVLITDSRGFAQQAIPVNGGYSGSQILVRATVTYEQLTTSAQNVFLLWW